jgi:hypothetical protein
LSNHQRKKISDPLATCLLLVVCHIFDLKLEAVSYSKTFENFCRTTRRHITEVTLFLVPDVRASILKLKVVLFIDMDIDSVVLRFSFGYLTFAEQLQQILTVFWWSRYTLPQTSLKVLHH